MNNNINPNQVQDVNMQNMNGQPVELTTTPSNMVNMDQMMGYSNNTATQAVGFDEKSYKMKKAAIYIFIIGALLIVMGVVYNILGIGSGKESTPQSSNQTTTEEVANEAGEEAGGNTEITTDSSGNEIENRMASSNTPSLVCKLNNKSTSNGINQVLTYEFYDNSGKLASYTKTYEVIPITGHSDGIVSVNKEIAKYDTLKSKLSNLSGYLMSVASINNGITETLTVKVNVNFKSFKNNLSGELKKNKITNVEYNSNSDIKTIKKELTKSGYSC